MKKLLLFQFMLLLTLSLAACEGGDPNPVSPPGPEQPENPDDDDSDSDTPAPGGNEENNSMNIKITIGDQTITATMEDNVTSRSFLAQLPLEITLNDYNNTEKIFYPDPKLPTNGAPIGCTPISGDITLYVPWGNIAIFYKNWSPDNNLIKLGHIDGNGIDALSTSGNITVKIERL